MSSTHRGAKRMADDFYETPPWATRAILRVLGPRDGVILDPCAGDGAILAVAREMCPVAHLSAIELRPEHEAACRGAMSGPFVRPTDLVIRDALLPESWRGRTTDRPHLVLTNPPFELSMEFVRRALDEVSRGGTVAMLLRLAFMASIERQAFHNERPADVFVLPRRPSFAASLKCSKKRETGCTYAEILPLKAPRPKACPLCGAKVSVTTNDSADYAWFVWSWGCGGRWKTLDIDGCEELPATTAGEGASE